MNYLQLSDGFTMALQQLTRQGTHTNMNRINFFDTFLNMYFLKCAVNTTEALSR